MHSCQICKYSTDSTCKYKIHCVEHCINNIYHKYICCRYSYKLLDSPKPKPKSPIRSPNQTIIIFGEKYYNVKL